MFIAIIKVTITRNCFLSGFFILLLCLMVMNANSSNYDNHRSCYLNTVPNGTLPAPGESTGFHNNSRYQVLTHPASTLDATDSRYQHTYFFTGHVVVITDPKDFISGHHYDPIHNQTRITISSAAPRILSCTEGLRLIHFESEAQQLVRRLQEFNSFSVSIMEPESGSSLNLWSVNDRSSGKKSGDNSLDEMSGSLFSRRDKLFYQPGPYFFPYGSSEISPVSVYMLRFSAGGGDKWPPRKGKMQKPMLQPINQIFRLLQDKTRVQIWLYGNLPLRIEGIIRGFDEFMNLVLDDAEEVNTRTGARTRLNSTLLLRGDTIALIAQAEVGTS